MSQKARTGIGSALRDRLDFPLFHTRGISNKASLLNYFKTYLLFLWLYNPLCATVLHRSARWQIQDPNTGKMQTLFFFFLVWKGKKMLSENLVDPNKRTRVGKWHMRRCNELPAGTVNYKVLLRWHTPAHTHNGAQQQSAFGHLRIFSYINCNMSQRGSRGGFCVYNNPNCTQDWQRVTHTQPGVSEQKGHRRLFIVRRCVSAKAAVSPEASRHKSKSRVQGGTTGNERRGRKGASTKTSYCPVLHDWHTDTHDSLGALAADVPRLWISDAVPDL